ncbi:hypothetical protein [Halorussus sp. AFM4]|uniref:hypothetical protein n=1 Tax=Halorussus sp. AFM4 TaxID=3421651 RepID=UPI003EB74B63
MADRSEAISVLIAAEFVVMAAIVFLLVPLEAAIPLVPLFVVLLFALHQYRS